jgi:hypothetical protein
MKWAGWVVLAMIAKAREWSQQVYAHLPALIAKSLIARFEYGHAAGATKTSASPTGVAGENSTQNGLDVWMVNRHLDTARFAHGVEDATLFSETSQPGENGVVASLNAVPTPDRIFQEAYWGEIFVEPETGMVLRTITKSEFQPNDILSSESVRTDYAPLPVDAGSFVVPIRRFKITELVEKDAKTGGKAMKRHRLVTEDFKDFQRSAEAAAIP